MQDWLIKWLSDLGLSQGLAKAIGVAAGILALALVAVVAGMIARQILLRTARQLASRTTTHWDDVFVERRVFNRLSWLVPALVAYWALPWVLDGYPRLAAVTVKLLTVYLVLLGLLVLGAALSAADDIYRSFEVSRRAPLKGLVQVAKTILYCIGGVVVLAVLLDRTPLYLLSGLGAITAVLLIVFKDPILGLVAGIQLSANRMIAIGDWIEMPSHNADGDVIDVALTTVKVQNWDKTISTIPTYDLISKSFKNWRGMQESGGRRIKRAIHLDLNTIRFCDAALLERLTKVRLLDDYLARKRQELAQHNAAQGIDDSSLVNGRRLTNVGTFRAYVVAYLRSLPQIHEQLTFLVRQLAPRETGLPIEIYVFTNDTAWVSYEGIQADIFDHILAVIPEFGLRVFQAPTGVDFRAGLRA